MQHPIFVPYSSVGKDVIQLWKLFMALVLGRARSFLAYFHTDESAHKWARSGIITKRYIFKNMSTFLGRQWRDTDVPERRIRRRNKRKFAQVDGRQFPGNDVGWNIWSRPRHERNLHFDPRRRRWNFWGDFCQNILNSFRCITWRFITWRHHSFHHLKENIFLSLLPKRIEFIM